MSKRDLFAELQEGLESYEQFDSGEIELPTIDYGKAEVRAIRDRTGLSQAEFAEVLSVNIRTLQNWEQGHRHPAGPARALLNLVEMLPDALPTLKSLKSSARRAA